MKIITRTDELSAFCERAKSGSYVTLDTEFLRERTYYSQLCLIQMALPGRDDEDAVLIDPLADKDLSLEPLYGLFRDETVIKVFHAARQDLEIFYVDAGVIPAPLFDTQIAAMVCGFGEQVAYATLVQKIAKSQIDKTSRFTDWSRRPLSDSQKSYALADVTHLREIYEHLEAELDKNGRRSWLTEEMDILRDPASYESEPGDAWQRIKTRNVSGRFLAIVRELAKFRESYAQARNVPRNRVFKDDVLTEIASTKPTDESGLGRLRLLTRDARKGDIATGIIAAVQAGLDCPKSDLPQKPQARDAIQVNPAIADMLRVLLKAKATEFQVASRLIASASDLDLIAAGQRDLPALHGWRNEVFGEEALRLCRGEIALTVHGKNIRTVAVGKNKGI